MTDVIAESMVEKVARAIAVTHRPEIDFAVDEFWEEFVPQARAAIGAISGALADAGYASAASTVREAMDEV
jgi:hypothetical protein